MHRNKIKIVCISDTHGKTDDLIFPSGDILIHAGDFSKKGIPSEVQAFNTFLSKQNFLYKIVIAGNHDLIFDVNNFEEIIKKKTVKNKPSFDASLYTNINCVETKKMLTEAIYLEDSMCEVLGLKIYGSPWSPEKSLSAFKLPRGELIKEKWERIPSNIDILITHTPPFKILDLNKSGVNCGCEELLKELDRIKPKVHVFGHIHDGYGREEHKDVVFINACSWGSNKSKNNEPIVFEI